MTLDHFEPARKFFIGIDSDGCVFDSMEIKHKECFTPNFIKHWKLQAVAKYAREVWEFVNLYSKSRGCNRWLALESSLDLLAARPETRARNVSIMNFDPLRKFIHSGKPMSNSSLKSWMAEHPDPIFDLSLAWTLGVDAFVRDIVEGVPPFPFFRESMAAVQQQSDTLVVSSTPVEALQREWEEHRINQFVRVICGQEQGTKAQVLRKAAQGRYDQDKILMIGDAPGDRKAAEAIGALFFPVNPGAEEASWERFYREATQKFFAGTYAGAYQQELIDEFEACLPEHPPWKTA